ncbi:MAG: glutathione S-transferase family protein [Gammaproteobacteria bacterium]|nr:glutathione S-transferase family protein [Gammaproteobacteria bacterium]MDE2251301.1 glutathione S-transferase family protein [Gammaproteobacteria bacterium]
MALVLYSHPFASYCWKVLIALYENGTPFEYRMVDEPRNFAELAARWPMKKFPLLVAGDETLVESSVIIEYLQLRHPGPVRFIPDQSAAALQARFMDRCFDNYFMTPMQKVVGDALRAAKVRDAFGVSEARGQLGQAYAWLESLLAGRMWAIGERFTLADCAAAPALFYADWAHAIGREFPQLRAYRERLLARPSIARVVDEARPYRKLFPLGAPERD